MTGILVKTTNNESGDVPRWSSVGVIRDEDNLLWIWWIFG